MINEDKFHDSSDIDLDDFESTIEAEKDIIFRYSDTLLTDVYDSTHKDEKPVENKSENTGVDISVFDVASYILHSLGNMSTMKLQKLVYYCQAWSLVWDEKPLYPESIKAWANGPVVGELFFQLKGLYIVGEEDLITGNYKKLLEQQIETIDSVLDHYGDKQSQWLINLTHMEEPWRKARTGIPEGDRSNRIIELEEMAMYYSSL